MNEQSEILGRKIGQLEKLLENYPDLTHVYMRRPDDVLVDVTRDQAKPTLIRHPDWTIENDQPGSKVRPPTDEDIKDVQKELAKSDAEYEAEQQVEVPPKPSEEGVADKLEEPQQEANKESKSVARRKAIQKAKK